MIQLGSSPVAYAHGDHGGGNPVLSDETVETLHEHLTEQIAEAVRHGAPEASSDEERQAGERLLDAVYDDIVADLKEQHPSFATQAVNQLKSIVKTFNPVALGHWVLETARRKGPGLAVAYGLSELSEQMSLLLAAKYHALLFLVPFTVTHAFDAIFLSTVFALPRVMRLIGLWQRFGGLASGAAGYYNQLLAQRKALPIDWSVVINVSSLPVELGGDSPQDLQFAIVKENLVQRNLPRGLRVALDPRALAQRESVPTFSIAELETIAKTSGVDLSTFKPFRAVPVIYSTILLREIAKNTGAAERFAAEVRIRHEKSSLGGVATPENAWGHAQLVDAEALFDADSPEALERLAESAGETPDLFAQRALWLLQTDQAEYEEQLDVAEKDPDKTPGVDLKLALKSFRALGGIVGPGQALARMASSSFPQASAADWKRLYDQLQKAAAARRSLEASLPPAHPEQCESLLLGA